MERVKKFVERYLVPQGFLAMRRNYLLKRFQNTLRFPENGVLENKEMSRRRAFLLATGPSLKKVDLDILVGECCITMSNFFVHPQFQSLKPAYHVLAPSHPPITSKEYSFFLQDAFDHMKHPITLFMGESDRHIVEKMDMPDNIQVYYYKSGGKFPIDLTKTIPTVRTVVHPALHLAIYLGIKELHLLGVDHSWISHYGVSQHFYEERESKLVQNSYNEWRHKDKGTLFKGYGLTWDVYRELRDFYAPKGIRVFNLNPNSMLDIFPFKDLKELLNGGENKSS